MFNKPMCGLQHVWLVPVVDQPPVCARLPLRQVPVGVVNITLQAAPRPVAEVLQVPEGSPVAMVTNLVVAAPWRRQGLARQLMVAAEAAVRQRQLEPTPDHIILLAYKDYQPAVGYVVWVGGWVPVCGAALAWALVAHSNTWHMLGAACNQ